MQFKLGSTFENVVNKREQANLLLGYRHVLTSASVTRHQPPAFPTTG